MMIKQALFLLGALSLCASVHAAGNAAEGQKKSTTCAACHGPDGNTPVIPTSPTNEQADPPTRMLWLTSEYW